MQLDQRSPKPLEGYIIWGMGGHSKVVADTIKEIGWTEVKFINDEIFNIQGKDWLLSEFPPTKWVAFVAIGDNKARVSKVDLLGKLGYYIPNVVHPTASISKTVFLGGHNIFIGPKVAICADAVISDGVILNTGCTVDHDCYIGRWAHIAPGVHLCGKVNVGLFTLVGVGASVIPGIKIGSSCIVGAGAAVVKDIPTGKTALGVPARIVEE